MGVRESGKPAVAKPMAGSSSAKLRRRGLELGEVFVDADHAVVVEEA